MLNLEHALSSPLLQDDKQPASFSYALVCLFPFKWDTVTAFTTYLKLKMFQMFLEMSVAVSKNSQAPLREQMKVLLCKF